MKIKHAFRGIFSFVHIKGGISVQFSAGKCLVSGLSMFIFAG
jgi:hypothetical protein